MAARFPETREPGAYIEPAYICGLTDDDLAKEIREAGEWDKDLIRDLCWRADLLDEMIEAGEGWEDVAQLAAEKLGVDIG